MPESHPVTPSAIQIEIIALYFLWTLYCESSMQHKQDQKSKVIRHEVQSQLGIRLGAHLHTKNINWGGKKANLQLKTYRECSDSQYSCSFFQLTTNLTVQDCPDRAQQNIYGHVQHLFGTNTKCKQNLQGHTSKILLFR